MYGTAGYEQGTGNLAQVSLPSDGVVGVGCSLPPATVTGTVAEGYVATLIVPV